MKKQLGRNVVILLLTTLTIPALSQDIAMNRTKGKIFSSEMGENSAGNLPVNDVNDKVLKSFQRSIGEKPGVAWGKTVENTFFAYYTENNKAHYAYFNNSGRLDYQVSRYSEESLPKDVRRILKNNFDYDAITYVSEVKKDNAVLYFVKIEDKISIKTVRIEGEEYEVVEKLVKQ